MGSEGEESFVYVYCVIPGGKYEDFGNIGLGGQGDRVYTICYKELCAVVSRCKLPKYERDDENILAHQRVVQKIFATYPAVPLPFSTVLKGESEVQGMLESRHVEFVDKLEKLGELMIQLPPSEPGKEIIEEALAHSFASALKMRQLSDELVRLKSSQPGESVISPGQKALMEELRALRAELHALRAFDRLAVRAAVSSEEELEAKAKATPTVPERVRPEEEDKDLKPSRRGRPLDGSVREALRGFYLAEPWAVGSATPRGARADSGRIEKRPTLADATRSALVAG